MENLPVLVHRIDQNDIIYYVNEEWIKFADINQTIGLHEFVLGRPIWKFINSEVVNNIYKQMVDKVRKTNSTISFVYRCDAPNTVREVKMSIIPLENGHVEFRNCIAREKNREPVALLDTAFTRNNNFVKMCSFCNSIETITGWMEIENALEIIHSEDGHIANVTHGICEDCFKQVEQDILNSKQAV